MLHGSSFCTRKNVAIHYLVAIILPDITVEGLLCIILHSNFSAELIKVHIKCGMDCVVTRRHVYEMLIDMVKLKKI